MKKSVLRTIIGILILAAILVLAINPAWIPFLSDAQVSAIEQMIQQTFVGQEDESSAALFSLPTLFAILAVIAGVSAVSMLLRFILEHINYKRNRSRTVAELLKSVVKYASVLVIIIWCLSIAGVNVAGIFASLGIISLIIGFGAESLIEDIITGIFIIFEGQYNVGDIIILDDFRGVVKRIGVRTTNIEDVGGNIKIVNNSDIRNVQNRSQNLSWAVCDVGISYDTRIESVETVLNANLPKISEKADGLFVEPLAYRGVQTLGESAVILRVVGKTNEADIFNAQRFLNREIKILFDDNNIEIPFNQLVVQSTAASAAAEKTAKPKKQ